MSRWVESVERVVAAPPEDIFALVADPRRHQDINGNGTVRDAVEAPERLVVGATFRLNMDFKGPYTMVSTVIEYEDNRRIAWQSRPPADEAKWRQLFGGRIWRYELEPVEGGTLVRESWDLSEERLRWVVRGYASRTRRNMERTLERIDALVTTDRG
jgi:uncharacterized protein YndB with AHSA1/START domain